MSGFQDQAVSLAKLSIVSIAYSQLSSVAAPSVSNWLTSFLMAPDASASQAVGGRIVPIESTKSRSLAVASAGGRPRAPVERFQGCRRQLALVCAHGWDLSGLKSRQNKHLRAATFPDTAVSCPYALAIAGIMPT